MLENTLKPNRLRARSIAKKLLVKIGTTAPPVKLAPIIKNLNLFAIPFNKNDFTNKNIFGFVSLEDGILAYNDSDPTVRKRFSVAHEIGHLLLGHPGQGGTFNLESKDPREVEANFFAAELLIPFDWIKTDLKEPEANVKTLASKYWVSELAMGWRIFNSDALLN